MRILVVHNRYRGPGGEDIAVRSEVELLRSHGHSVWEWWRSNDEVRGRVQELRASGSALWSRRTVRDLGEVMKSFRPKVAHFHNTWFAVSPSGYWIARRHGAAVVQTLHNYRLLCPSAQFLRGGVPCEQCKTRVFPIPGVLHGCYRGSRLHSLAVGATTGIHRVLGTWQSKIDVYVALTHFARRKFIEGGLPADRVLVKPNFVEIEPEPSVNGSGAYAIFVGRLSEEKGIRTLLRAWARPLDIPLHIVGDGPLCREVLESTRTARSIRVLGWRRRQEAIARLALARFLVFPSICYEGLGLAILEAFACGVPVIAARHGSMKETVADGVTGLHFEPGDPDDLALKVEWAWKHPAEVREMGRRARREYERHYGPETNYRALLDIYASALSRSTGSPATPRHDLPVESLS